MNVKLSVFHLRVAMLVVNVAVALGLASHYLYSMHVPFFKNLFPRETADLPEILAAGNELQQVIINLVQNAVQAVDEKQWSAAEEPLIQVATRRLPQHAEITVVDNGPGMDEALQKQIFEPFFTTKDVGYGTVLGLSISYFIVTEHHGGEIEVQSTPGEGTRFVITLPLAA